MTRRRALTLSLFAALVLVLALLRKRPEPPHNVARHDAPAEPNSAGAPSAPAALDDSSSNVASVGAAPEIDELKVEPPVVCAGEESLVTVRAHVPGKSDPGLHAVIGGVPGTSVPVVGRLSLDGNPLPLFAAVYSSEQGVKTVPVPLEVRDCDAPPRAAITFTALANSTDEIEFTARVVTTDRHGRPVKSGDHVRRYMWSFGDGQFADSETPTISHSYAARSQDAYFSSFVIGVDAVLESGHSVHGRTALQLSNRQKRDLDEKGVVVVQPSYTPRFPEAQEDGSVTQRVHLSHIAKSDVRIASVLMRKSYSDGRTTMQPIDPQELLGGTTTIPARTGLDVPLRLASDDQAVVTLYDLRGTTSDGRPAGGSMSILRPPPLPTPDHHRDVPPAFARKIAAAQKALNKQYVTGEEIARLEREGRL